MTGHSLLMLYSLLLGALVVAAEENFLIQIELNPPTLNNIQLLDKHLDCIGTNKIISGERKLHNSVLRYVRRRFIEDHIQQAIGHIKRNRALYSPFFELPIDIIIPSDDDTQQHNNAAQEDNEKIRHQSRYYERDLKLQKVILSSDITIVTATIPHARAVSSLNETKWQDGSNALPAPRECQLKCTKLDDVYTTFSACLNEDEVDTAQLIEACKAHLVFMRKSGGNSLRLVAKDLESNIQKAEKPFKLSPEQGRTLLSLLQSEREAGIHKGSILKEHSAAMGLLWIRRSLAFQLELYASLINQDGPHPRDAAYAAYTKHLSPFHGFALRKLFPATLSKMPNRQEFIAKFGEVTLNELNEEIKREVVNKLESLLSVWDPLIRKWEKDFASLNLEDVRRV